MKHYGKTRYASHSLKAMRMPGFLLMVFILASCNNAQVYEQQAVEKTNPVPLPKSVGNIPLPNGYKRIAASNGGYPSFLRSISLKSDKTVYLFNGVKKGNQQAQYAVIDMDAGQKDLQQCADAVMRIRAEYLFSKKDFSHISFNFTNGFACDFEHYAQGYRVKTIGNTCTWVKQKPESYTYSTFRQYLDVVYAYAGTQSLHQQLKSIPVTDIHPGAVFIQTRNPYGHAVTVMDMAYHPQTKDTIFLLSQSYMPAQDIHILVNPNNEKISPWYSTKFGDELRTPEWTFTKEDLKEF
jgi:hypothetical protein